MLFVVNYITDPSIFWFSTHALNNLTIIFDQAYAKNPKSIEKLFFVVCFHVTSTCILRYTV